METGTLKIKEIFFSIQGESLFAGKPTVFVRTATCNLRCTYCDTRYAFWEGRLQTLDAILTEVQKHKTRYVCLTGGEPLGQKMIYPLMRRLVDLGYTVSLETGGGFSLKGVPPGVVKVLDLKCPSSGETKSMVWENLALLTPADQVKFVIGSREDYEWAVQQCESKGLHDACTVLFSPVYGKIENRLLARWVLEAPVPVTMQIQMHKTIWGPDVTGV